SDGSRLGVLRRSAHGNLAGLHALLEPPEPLSDLAVRALAEHGGHGCAEPSPGGCAGQNDPHFGSPRNGGRLEVNRAGVGDVGTFYSAPGYELAELIG